MRDRGDIGIIACNSGKPFAERVMEGLQHQFAKNEVSNTARLIQTREKHFGNGEVETEIEESIRGLDIYVVQDVENKVTRYAIDKNLRAAKTALDAAWRADAHYCTAVLPYFAYSRQERAIGRTCITAAQVARELEQTCADRVITLEIHSEAIAGVFQRTKFENLHASKNLLDYIREHLDITGVVAPDTGAAKLCSGYASRLQTELSFIWKRRDYAQIEKVEEMVLQGDVKGKRVLLVDDMIGTAGTLVSACELLHHHGAEEINFATSLPLFTRPAIRRITRAHKRGILNQVIGTDAVYHGGQDFLDAHPWYREVSVAGYFAKVIYNINHYRSISALLQ